MSASVDGWARVSCALEVCGCECWGLKSEAAPATSRCLPDHRHMPDHKVEVGVDVTIYRQGVTLGLVSKDLSAL